MQRMKSWTPDEGEVGEQGKQKKHKRKKQTGRCRTNTEWGQIAS